MPDDRVLLPVLACRLTLQQVSKIRHLPLATAPAVCLRGCSILTCPSASHLVSQSWPSGSDSQVSLVGKRASPDS